MRNIFFLFFTLGTGICNLGAQERDTIKILNGSFEDTPRQGGEAFLAIKGWYDCGALRFPEETPPDIHPGNFWNNELPASSGLTYLGMVVRDNDTYEGVAQRLASPMEAGKCYSFSIELARSPKYISSSRITVEPRNYITPTVLRVWGGSGFCNEKELLAESPAIDHSAWKTYSFNFKPRFNHRYIMVEAFYKVPVFNPYCGHILVDNISDMYMVSCDEEQIIAAAPVKPTTQTKLPPHKQSRVDQATQKETPKVVIPPAAKKTKPKVLEDLDIATLKTGTTVEIKNLYFKADTSSINDNSYEVLDEIYDFLIENTKVSLEIGGHTNGIPPHEYCDRLSTDRAKAVYMYLIKKGVSSSQLSFRGYGKRRRVASDATAEGRNKNQRVELKVVSLG